METLRLLVVDDEPGMRMGVARALRDYRVALAELDLNVSFEIGTAESGEQGIEIIEKECPDILLLDHKLPGMSGLDVLERISEKQYPIQTIMITAYASVETAVTAIKLGAYDFLAKPFTPTELKATIEKVTEYVVTSRQARKLARERRQMRFQFISVVAHELKAPLAAIEGYLRIILERSAGDDPAVYDHMIERSLLRTEGMRKMILDLLDLTRIESGQKKRELVELDVAEAAGEAMETFLPDAKQRDIAIELKHEGAVPLRADHGEIEIIFNNLISNAVKYNRDGGHVTVELKQDAETVTIAVTDTGIGMSQAEADKLFEDFVRIKNAKTRKILGSGLGLSILKKISQLYGGTVKVQSEPDQGSTFTITLRKDYGPGDGQEPRGDDGAAALSMSG